MMKINEEKHNHKLTNLLKVFIFSVLMILPFLNVAVRCGYVMLNKNAYESYSGQETLTYDHLSSIDDLVIGQVYNFNNQLGTYTSTTQQNTGRVMYSNPTNITTTNINFVNLVNISNSFTFYYNTDGISIYFTYNASDTGNAILNSSQLLSFDFIFEGKQTNLNNNYSFLTKRNQLSSNYMDNVFEYSINKLEEEQYLAWTQNTAVYQGVESMTTGLGITQTVIPMLIVYWFMLTIIYVIIDMVLAIFTKLTHMIGNKTT